MKSWEHVRQGGHDVSEGMLYLSMLTFGDMLNFERKYGDEIFKLNVNIEALVHAISTQRSTCHTSTSWQIRCGRARAKQLLVWIMLSILQTQGFRYIDETCILYQQ